MVEYDNANDVDGDEKDVNNDGGDGEYEMHELSENGWIGGCVGGVDDGEDEDGEDRCWCCCG